MKALFFDTLKGRIAPHFSAEYPALLCHKVRGLESVSFKPRTSVRGETLSRTFMTCRRKVQKRGNG